MALKHILGDIPVIKILDFLIDHTQQDYTKAEIAYETQVGPTSMKNDLQSLIKCGVIVETRKIGGVQLYTLDMDNKMTQSLMTLDKELIDYCTDRILIIEAKENEDDDNWICP